MKLPDLTKENFWDGLAAEYPKAMEEFLKWIDQYKVDNNWQRLFNPKFHSKRISGYVYAGNLITEDDWPKFHELPLAMQLGIFTQFNAETLCNEDKVEVLSFTDYRAKEIIRNNFYTIEGALSER